MYLYMSRQYQHLIVSSIFPFKFELAIQLHLSIFRFDVTTCH